MSCQGNCSKGNSPAQTLVFSCSGAADVGELADRAARELSRRGFGKMFCLAGVGGQLPSFIEMTGKAQNVLAIDGCPVSCARVILENSGIKDFIHLELSTLKHVKGATAITPESINDVCAECSKLI